MQPAQERSAVIAANVIITRRGRGVLHGRRYPQRAIMILLSGTVLIKFKINTGGLCPVPSASGDLFAKFLALGYVGPDDLKEMKARSSALGIPLAEAALLADRLHPDARAWILSESLGIPFLEVEPDSISLELAHLFPEALARENWIV